MLKSLNILIVDDERIIRDTVGDYLSDSGHKVDKVENGSIALKKVKKTEYDLALVDVQMPVMDGLTFLEKQKKLHSDMAVIIITAHRDYDAVVRALRMGAADFLNKPLKMEELDAVIEKAMRYRRLTIEKEHLSDTIKGLQDLDLLKYGSQYLVGTSPAMNEIRIQIKNIVETKCDTVLISGETGTGKEMVAREIHHQSDEGSGPFVAVSCPALPDSLVESELFGHTRGAFTGATEERAGFFELADAGTIFLDEVGDLSSQAQAVLLRVLETRQIRRIGSSKEKNVNVRVLAATNRPLEELLQEGKFRKDLFYRLNVCHVDIPPLQDRKDDILPLAEHFLNLYIRPRGFRIDGFSKSVKDLFLGYGFPGNARELKNIVERAAMLARSGIIDAEHVKLLDFSQSASISPKKSKERDDEKTTILKVLEENQWHRGKAAAQLGLSYSALCYRINKFGLAKK
jgi:DNA-binding NtrC family response regulator